MCLYIQPICNACGAVANEVELHKCIFHDCKYVERCTRLLTRYELFEWSCDTPDCGLNWKNIDDKLDEIHQMLRMEVSLPTRPAEGNNLKSQEDNNAASEAHNDHATNIGDSKAGLRGFDGDGTSQTKGAMNTLSADTASITASLSVTVPAAPVNIPSRPLSAQTPEVTSSDSVDPTNSLTTENKVATSDNADAGEDAAASGNVATNDSFATNNEVAEDSSIQREFDPDSIDPDTFPRCRSCFIGRRRCDGQTPCDKCQQRRCSRSCRPVTIDLLRMYPARAERILDLSRRD